MTVWLFCIIIILILFLCEMYMYGTCNYPAKTCVCIVYMYSAWSKPVQPERNPTLIPIISSKAEFTLVQQTILSPHLLPHQLPWLQVVSMRKPYKNLHLISVRGHAISFTPKHCRKYQLIIVFLHFAFEPKHYTRFMEMICDELW